MGKGSRGWIVTIDWVLDPNNLTKVFEGNFHDQIFGKMSGYDDLNQGGAHFSAANSSHQLLSTIPSVTSISASSDASALLLSEAQIRESISQIKNPIWKAVSEEVLGNIGYRAFGDLFNANLEDINKGDKRANFKCHSSSVLYKAERYQFIILKALQRFYPDLAAITAEFGQETAHENDMAGSANVHLITHIHQ